MSSQSRHWLLRGSLIVFVYTFAVGAVGQGGDTHLARGIKSEATPSIRNAEMTRNGDRFELKRMSSGHPMRVEFANSTVIGVRRDKNQWWVLPASETVNQVTANTSVWVLPLDTGTGAPAWFLDLSGHEATARLGDRKVEVDIDADAVKLASAEARPHSDVFGHRFSVSVDGNHDLENALAGFYWGTMLPLVAERTIAAKFPYSDGYVLSTLVTSAYAGTYPAVDHEFQIAGRLAMGSTLDLDVVRRMIELQFKVMRDDPEGLFRDPCSVQPDGRREYHIRRNSKDNRENAAMFPVTGNIEVIGESWHFYEASKNMEWLRAHIENLEHAAGWTLSHTDQYGRLWSDVYYEDQVMKDGRETEAQAFAAHSFELLSRMEGLLGRQQESQRYAAVAKQMVSSLLSPLPMGYWDDANQRFTDWVDRSSKTHDHIHLVANTAPVTLGYATPSQTTAVKQVIAANDAEFQRFPSFVAAHVEAYNDSEQGVAGPYDLSAAGRYWFWDAAYRSATNDGATLLHQLTKVAAEGAKDSYLMGERYDMDHIYYIDGQNAHGAKKYFEYPNVFTSVLISDLLGIRKTADADVSLAPHLPAFGAAEFETPAYQLSYTYAQDGFTLKNLASTKRMFDVNLSGVGSSLRWTPGRRSVAPDAHGTYKLQLAPGETVHWASVH